jgi:ARC6-like, IMS domain
MKDKVEIHMSLQYLATEEEKRNTGIMIMDAKLAESIVRKWQNYKSLAMGATHQLDPLKEVLALSLFHANYLVLLDFFVSLKQDMLH